MLVDVCWSKCCSVQGNALQENNHVTNHVAADFQKKKKNIRFRKSVEQILRGRVLHYPVARAWTRVAMSSQRAGCATRSVAQEGVQAAKATAKARTRTLTRAAAAEGQATGSPTVVIAMRIAAPAGKKGHESNMQIKPKNKHQCTCGGSGFRRHGRRSNQGDP